VRLAVLALCAFFLALGCPSSAPAPRHAAPAPPAPAPPAEAPPAEAPPAEAPTVRAPPTEAPADLPAPVTLRLATFNIQVLGPAKSSRPEVLAVLARIIRQYDLVAVQEIRDRSGQAPLRLLAAINANDATPQYSLALSERTGRQPDDRSSQEQYAYYYREDRLRARDEGTLFDDEPHDHFQREPYLNRFQIIGTDVSFIVINVHTRPRSALQEIAAMEHVFIWAKDFYADEEVFIAVGDFNAGCGYASEEDLDSLTPPTPTSPTASAPTTAS
jgi:endonuclease/exonuclease/phosphatase family metal-dependent hydrolase